MTVSHPYVGDGLSVDHVLCDTLSFHVLVRILSQVWSQAWPGTLAQNTADVTAALSAVVALLVVSLALTTDDGSGDVSP